MDARHDNRSAAEVTCGPDHSVRVRPGEYLVLGEELDWWERAEQVHRARLDSAMEHVTGAVAVLESAALVHGASVKVVPEQAHLWVPWRRKATPGRTGRLWDLPRTDREARLATRPVVNHRMDLVDRELTVRDGVLVTDLVQTTLHCARFLPPDRAFAVVDSLVAIASGRGENWRSQRTEVEESSRIFRQSLLHKLSDLRGHRGVAQARAILRCSTPLAESVWESELRRVALAAGYLDAEPQMEVRTEQGTRWADVGIRRSRCCFEANGEIKYAGPTGREVRLSQAARTREVIGAGYRVVDLAVPEIRDTEGLLHVLDLGAGDTRQRSGIRALWTPAERRRFT